MKKNPFKIDVVSVRLVKDAPLYSEHPLDSPKEVVRRLGQEMCEFDREVVCVIHVNSKSQPINCTYVSVGALDQCFVTPREMLKAAFLSNARGIIMLHNHPSGNLNPSKCDTEITDRMIQICRMVEIDLLDHIIVGGDNSEYFSFNEKNMIRYPAEHNTTDYRELKFAESSAERSAR